MKFLEKHPNLIPRLLVILLIVVGILDYYSPQFRLKIEHGWDCFQVAEVTFEEGPATFLVSEAGEDLYVDFLMWEKRGVPRLRTYYTVQGWALGRGRYLPPIKNDKIPPSIELAVLARWVDAPGTEQTFPVEEPVEIRVRYYPAGERTLETVLFRWERPEDWESADYIQPQWQIDKANELLGEAS